MSSPAAEDRATGPVERVDALNSVAWELRNRDPARAAELAREACALAGDGFYLRGEAYARRTLGVCHYHRSEYDAALAELGTALQLFERAGDETGRAGALNGIGNVHWRLGSHPEALRLHLTALRAQRETGDRDGEAASLNFAGNVHYHVGDYARALEHYRASLALREAGGDAAGVAYCLNNIGNILGRLGEFEEALDYHLRSLALKEEVGDRHGSGVSLLNVATCHESLRDPARAMEFFARALERLRETENRDGEADCLRELGQVHERGGELDRALACYSESLEITREVRSRFFEVETLIRLGEVRTRLGETGAALADLGEALETAEEIGSRRLVYEAHRALSGLWAALGESARALEHHRAFHAGWEEVFNAESDARIRSIQVQAEVERAHREAELYRLRNEELTRAYASLRDADEEKARLLEQLRLQAAELDRRTREDSLTGLHNRRHVDERLGVEFERSRRFGRDLAVCVADLDEFKQVNDRFSHAVGDEVLRRVAQTLREGCRGVDVVGRYGGEEFVLILVETPAERAAAVCDRLRDAVAGADWSIPVPRPGRHPQHRPVRRPGLFLPRAAPVPGRRQAVRGQAGRAEPGVLVKDRV